MRSYVYWPSFYCAIAFYLVLCILCASFRVINVDDDDDDDDRDNCLQPGVYVGCA